MKSSNLTKTLLPNRMALVFLLILPFSILSAKNHTGHLLQQHNHPSNYEAFIANVFLLNNDGSTTFADGTLAQFNNAWSPLVDFMDGVKFGNINEQLSLLRTNVALALERRPIIPATDTLFLKLTKTTQRNYRMQIITCNLDHPGLQGFITDSYTGIPIQIDLNGTTTFYFSVDANPGSSASNRFTAIFSPITILPVTFRNILAIREVNGIAVQWQVDKELNIDSYNIEHASDGHTFYSIGSILANGNNHAGTIHYNWKDAHPLARDNFYRIRSVGLNGSISYSDIVKVSVTKQGASLFIYPNPVLDNRIGIQMNDAPNGVYRIRLLNLFGQVLYNESLIHVEGANTEFINLKQNITKGYYQLEVIKPDNSKETLQMVY
jgi:hypothetical protein